jgi:hypothetical protein
MAIRDLIPWTKNQQLATTGDAYDPFLTLHREMNRLFDDSAGSATSAASAPRGWKASFPGRASNSVRPRRP